MTIHSIYARISPYFRKRRLRIFANKLRPQPSQQLLDVGGYPWCWPDDFAKIKVTLLNRSFECGLENKYPTFTYVVGDGCALPFDKNQFDIVFSNSVIEHLGSWENQMRFADEAKRVGRNLWIQTPARGFFIEPHLIAPFVHWLPRAWQKRLIRYFTIWGWMSRPTPEQVEEFLAEVHLLTRAQMSELFPDCEILEEKFLGMTKSYVAFRRSESLLT